MGLILKGTLRVSAFMCGAKGDEITRSSGILPCCRLRSAPKSGNRRKSAGNERLKRFNAISTPMTRASVKCYHYRAVRIAPGDRIPPTVCKDYDIPEELWDKPLVWC